MRIKQFSKKYMLQDAGRKIAGKTAEACMNQRDIAKALGKAPSTYCKKIKGQIERGEDNFTLGDLATIIATTKNWTIEEVIQVMGVKNEIIKSS